MSEQQHRTTISSLERDRARAESARSNATAAAAAARKKAADHRQRAIKASSSTARSHLRAAEAADKVEVAETKKATSAADKVATLVKKITDEEAKLASAVRSSERRNESARKSAEREREAKDRSRRAAELRHAREVGRATNPMVVHHVVREVPPPKAERLRVLYLTASPLSSFAADEHLRVDAEVRMVQQHLRSALHRDLVTVEVRPAATPSDLVDGLNDVRPHVIHFAGHAGGGALLFDNGSVDAPAGVDLGLTQLGRALAATSTPPSLVVLNGCETLDGADPLIDVVPIIVAMADSITDLAAATFAAACYRAVASAQSVQAAFDQGLLAVELLGSDEESPPHLLSRVDVDPTSIVLVTPP